ncbi:MAG: hypothetical protein ABR865_10350 [Terracidiphilus sp.]
MEFIIRKLRVQNLKAQVAIRRYVCEFLEREFHTPTLTTQERAALARHWDIASKESYELQRMLDLIEGEENEELGDVNRGTATLHLRTVNGDPRTGSPSPAR